MNYDDWSVKNQRYMTAAVDVVRCHLTGVLEPSNQEGQAAVSAANRRLEEIARGVESPMALDVVCDAFSLSSFERDLLVLCAGVELDSSMADLVAAARGGTRQSAPTFSLALSVLPEGHWSALTPAGPLRRWRLIEVGSGNGLSNSPLTIDERVLHYLAGVSHIDARLLGLTQPVRGSRRLPPSLQRLAQRIRETWSAAPHNAAPVIQLIGTAEGDVRLVALEASAALDCHLYRIDGRDIPPSAQERYALARLWEREAILSNAVLMVDAVDAEVLPRVASFVSSASAMLIIRASDPLVLEERSTLTLDIPTPSTAEQLALWQDVLGDDATSMNGELKQLVSQFQLGVDTIHATGLQWAAGRERVKDRDGATLWRLCRHQARQRLDRLAQRIVPIATWPDLILPEAQLETLYAIATHVRQRAQVYDAWGFAGKSTRGLGISALFTGTSGTGKTMAAEVLANELDLDLYRIDLSQVVSKYIGETEKNLRRVFDAAEQSGAILLFDEADALFGKRSEVKDSHDRYANIEVSYLLQRMETYRGLAVLTTNLRKALDQAFLRRIRFVVAFPFPDVDLRSEIWRRVFPATTPTDELNIGKLARLNVAGGNIHNIALHAAFIAADAGQPVRMTHLQRAARLEYAKLEKPLTDNECREWNC